MGEEMVTVWVARRPPGDECSKTGSILGKRLTEEEALRAAVEGAGRFASGLGRHGDFSEL